MSLLRSKERRSSRYHFEPFHGQQKPALSRAAAAAAAAADMDSTSQCKRLQLYVYVFLCVY